MIIVRKVDGAWQALPEIVTLVEHATTYTAQYRDGRQVEMPCDPYPVETAPMDAWKIASLVAEGVWGDDDLTKYGLMVVAAFIAPEGKQRIGSPRYVEKKGVVSEVYEVEDIPPPAPEPSAAEKLAALGLTSDDLRQLMDDKA